MSGKLTPEFADSVSLSYEPFHRHEQVVNILGDEGLEAGELRIMVNPGRDVSEVHGERVVTVRTLTPLLGRRALTKIAQAINVTE